MSNNLSNWVATRVGTQLNDRDMKVFDKKTKVKVAQDWRLKDRPVAVVDEALKQLAGEWEIYTDHIIPDLTPISNQGGAGTCAANAWCDLLEILDGLQGKDKVEQLSRRFLYWLSRVYTGDEMYDDGMYLRAGAHQLSTIGVVEEKYFEYSDSPEYIISGGKYASPELDLYTMASNNRLKGFYRVDAATSLDNYLSSLELAIRANHPFVFGAPVDTAFTKLRSMEVVGPPDSTLGWHAMICLGVTFDGEQRRWVLRNSWGAGWGGKGYVKVTDDYVLKFRDIWIGTQVGEMV